jgi:hypothetical protein
MAKCPRAEIVTSMIYFDIKHKDINDNGN